MNTGSKRLSVGAGVGVPGGRGEVHGLRRVFPWRDLLSAVAVPTLVFLPSVAPAQTGPITGNIPTQALARLHHGGPEPLEARKLSVRFKGPEPEADYARILRSLSEHRLLEFEPMIDHVGQKPQEILAHNGRLVGKVVAPELEELLCRRNSHVCRLLSGRGGRRFGKWTNQKAPKGASLDADARCDGGEGDLPKFAMCLPKVLVLDYQAVANLPSPLPKEEAESLAKKGDGCDEFEGKCSDLLKKLNRFSSGTYSRIPVRAQRVALHPVPADRSETRVQVLKGVIREIRGSAGVGVSRVALSVPFEGGGSAASPAETQFDPDPFDDADVEGQIGLDGARPLHVAPRTVGMLDFHVDDEHCDLQAGARPAVIASRTLAPKLSTAQPPERSGNCEDRRPPGYTINQKWDHGTHVAGVIAARSNGQGISGANPHSWVWAWEVSGRRLSESDPFFELYEDMTRLQREEGQGFPDPEVINLSLEARESRVTNDLERVIMDHSDEFLFVAAAGNDGKEMRNARACDVVPACLSTDERSSRTVVSVVGLGRDGLDVLDETDSKSNYGQAFDVAAPGRAISSLHGDWFGYMPGSSVAAAYTSGLASLVFGRAKRLSLQASPATVKSRILYTSDLLPSLEKKLRFGRINFERALRMDKALVEMRPRYCDDAECEFEGVFEVGPSAGEEMLRLIAGSPGKEEIPQASIRRLALRDSEGRGEPKYDLVFEDEDRLEVYRGVVLDPAAEFSFKRAGKSRPRRHRWTTIADYTSAML